MSRSSRKEEAEAEVQREDRSTLDDDSDSNSDAGTIEARLRSLPHIEAFGHCYHISGKIFLPFDKCEQERMELMHKIYRHCLDGALTSTRLPLSTAQILDLGTGTGVWAIEMGARYPQAQITGIDVYPIQRKKGVPPNVKFQVDDVENPWPFPDNSLDFIHARSIAGGVRDWPALLRQTYDKLKPGGLFEMTEVALNMLDFNGKFGEAELCPEFLQMFRDFCAEHDIDFNPSPQIPDMLVAADFEKIVQRSEILPIGNWAQDEKLRTRQIMMNRITTEEYSQLHVSCGLLFQKKGWTKAELDARVPGFWAEVFAEPNRPYVRAVFTTARKPRAGEGT